MDLSKIKAENSADQKLVNEGATLDFGEFTLQVARWGNPQFEMHWRRIFSQQDVKRKIDQDRLDPKEDRKLVDDVIAHTVLVGWTNVEENGKPIPYTPEKGLELLKAEFLREEIIRFARENANFRIRTIEDGIEALKKS